MKNIKTFYHEYVGDLDEEVNDWFSRNPNISLISHKFATDTDDTLYTQIIYMETDQKTQRNILNSLSGL